MKYIGERITIDDNICNGRPVIQGTRITVQTILDFLSAGDSAEEILKQYPALKPDDINACIRFVADLMEYKTTTNKPFDAIEFMREQRRRLSDKLSKMTKAEIVAYFRHKRKENGVRPSAS